MNRVAPQGQRIEPRQPIGTLRQRVALVAALAISVALRWFTLDKGIWVELSTPHYSTDLPKQSATTIEMDADASSPARASERCGIAWLTAYGAPVSN